MEMTVWAPFAKTVELVVTGMSIPLQKADDGWWRADADESLIATGYQYSLDGAPPVPDPRSRWQPEGVHGKSFFIDLEQLIAQVRPGFRQRDLKEAIMYELHVGTFTSEGTYAAAEAKLSFLVDLGVTHIELLPIATFPGEHGWGYDGVYWYAPLPAYGSPAALVHFINECHERGLAVLLDVVYNHVGPDGNYFHEFGPYLTDRIKTPWGDALNFDGRHSNEVRRFVIDNATMWLRDYGFDGLRLDAVHTIYSFEAVHILEELADAVRRLGEQTGRKLVLIAESDLNDPKLVYPGERGGYGLDAQWSDDFHHALHGYFTGEAKAVLADFRGLADLATALREGYVYQGQYSAFRVRNHGRPPRGIVPSQLIVCAQNHDQIGNRAKGERLSMLLPTPQLKAIAALVILGPFVPLLFQGEEWGATTPFLYFTDHKDPELIKMVHEGRRKDFASFWQDEVPDPQASDTFQRSQLDWAQLDSPVHQNMLEWYRSLIKIRRAGNCAGDSFPRVAFDERARWLTFTRGNEWVVLNLAPQPQRIAHPQGLSLLLSSHPGVPDPRSELAPFETRVFS